MVEIKPWRVPDCRERLPGSNGLLLTPGTVPASIGERAGVGSRDVLRPGFRFSRCPTLLACSMMALFRLTTAENYLSIVWRMGTQCRRWESTWIAS